MSEKIPNLETRYEKDDDTFEIEISDEELEPREKLSRSAKTKEKKILVTMNLFSVNLRNKVPEIVELQEK